MEFEGKRVTVVGLGRSGIAASELLVRLGAIVTATDIKGGDQLADQLPGLRSLGVRLSLGGHPLHDLLNSDVVVVSPGVPLSIEPLAAAREAGIPIISEVELAAHFLKGNLIGITGSNGKTTVTALIGHLLSRAGFFVQVGGNIGQPLSRLVEGSREDGFAVVELSSFQLEAILKFRAHVALMTNISADHLDRHGSLESYVAAKRRIFLNQCEGDWAVLNADDPIVRRMTDDTRARVISFSRQQPLDRGVFLSKGRVILRWDDQEQELVTREEIPLRGWHNVENAMAALAAALVAASLSEKPEAGSQKAARCSSPVAGEKALASNPQRETSNPIASRLLSLASRLPLGDALKTFKGVEHRLEFVATINGVDYYNDSKATNVDSTIKALEAFEGKIIVILGGKDKGSDFSPLRPLIAEKAKHVILLGATSEKIALALEGAAPMTRCSTMAEAVRSAACLAERGDTVLLAPACASFDMFENFEHRGRVFKEEVKKLRMPHKTHRRGAKDAKKNEKKP